MEDEYRINTKQVMIVGNAFRFIMDVLEVPVIVRSDEGGPWQSHDYEV